MKKILFIVIVLFTVSITAQNENSSNKKKSKESEEDSGTVQALFVPPGGGGGGDTYPWNRDGDGDGYGDPNVQVEAETQPAGYVANNSDCDDYNSSVYPGALEVCDGVDNDCDGSIDEGAPSTPSTPTITNNCGSTVLTRSTPPSGITFYWQSTSSGTSTSNSNSTITRTSGTVYYLRAKNNTTGCWSSSRSVSYSVNATPSIPSTPTITNNCGNTVLIRSTPPSGITFYWQSNSTGTSTSNSSSTITRTSGTVYYSRAKNNTTGCWSSIRTISYTVTPPTTWYADTDGDSYGNSNVTTSACSQPIGYVSNSNDYDDSTVNITNIAPQIFYKDIDADSFGDPNDTVYYSVKPSGYVTNSLDNCPNDYGTNNGCDYYEPNFSNENYVYTRVYKEPMLDPSEILKISDVSESITYFDGLGRPMQQIGIKQSPDKTDIITHIAYDDYGRQDIDFLPYVPTQSGNEGAYRTDDQEAAIVAYYNVHYPNDLLAGSENPYSKKEFENSPLNRVLKQAAPGEDWKLGNDHEIEFDYQANIAGEVKLYTVTLTPDYYPTLVGGINSYGVNELYKTITRDENHSGTSKNHTTEEFKDKQGRVVLKRTYADMDLNGDGDTMDANELEIPHDTYYIYDDYGNLTYVFPPKMDATTNDLTAINNQLNELGYQYKYDKRNRLAKKKIPGKDWEYIVYDKLNHPVLTQDAVQRPNKQWLFTKYDVFGRVAYTGIYTHIAGVIEQIAMQNHFDDNHLTESSFYEEKVSSGTGVDGSFYTNNDFPKLDVEVLTVNYYDNYSFDLAGSALPQNLPQVYGKTLTTNVRGLATGSKVKVLGTSDWITTINYYDDKARLIYVYSFNDYLNTTDRVESDLDFVGKVDQTKTYHTNTNNTQATIIVEDTFTYDHMGRLEKQMQTIGTQTEVIVINTYDNLGQLVSKNVGNIDAAPLQRISYTYNVRGWLKNINQDLDDDNDLFSFTIMYNDIVDTSKRLFNGNISQTSWNTLSINPDPPNNPVSTSYTYTYDALNRITSAIDDTSNQHYSLTSISYDKNGNIQNLVRNGHLVQTPTLSTHFGVMDNLSYEYFDGGNRLKKVTDAISGTSGKGEFNDGNKVADDYGYDANGNMITDVNKGITSISYNHLNLPTFVEIASVGEDGNVTYIYDATGVKLRKIVIDDNTQSSTTTDYAGNYVYVKVDTGPNELQFFNTPEGYVEPEDPTDYSLGFNYIYQYKDHLGNIRLSYSDSDGNGSINASTEIISEKNYYPFGLEHKGYNNVVNGTEHPYKYQGQEFTQDLGLNIYEFAFRGYDPAIGRFMQIDPLAEDYVYNSTYAFAENKVINSRELEGLEAWESINNWDEKTIQQYRDYASQRAEEYRTNGTSCTCEDLAVNTLIDFASENKLPVYFQNGTGMYDSSSDAYDNIGDFRNDVLVSTGATDLTNNTTSTSNNDLLSGDLILFTNDKGRINHTQVVTGTDSETISIHQGNFVSNWEMFNYLKWSSDPQSSHYLGAKIQTGLYLKKTGDYYRDGKTKGLLNSDATQGRTWNFSQFNWRESIWDSYYQK